VDADDLPLPDSGAALEAASRFCDTAIVDILVEHGAKIKNSLALHHALMRQVEDRILMMEHLLRLGVDVNHFGWLTPLPHGGTALHLAAFLGQVNETRWLLEHGANPTVFARRQIMPEGYAALRNHTTVVKLIHDWRGIVPIPAQQR
jgi:ankyrin repeat protein